MYLLFIAVCELAGDHDRGACESSGDTGYKLVEIELMAHRGQVQVQVIGFLQPHKVFHIIKGNTATEIDSIDTPALEEVAHK